MNRSDTRRAAEEKVFLSQEKGNRMCEGPGGAKRENPLVIVWTSCVKKEPGNAALEGETQQEVKGGPGS